MRRTRHGIVLGSMSGSVIASLWLAGSPVAATGPEAMIFSLAKVSKRHYDRPMNKTIKQAVASAITLIGTIGLLIGTIALLASVSA